MAAKCRRRATPIRPGLRAEMPLRSSIYNIDAGANDLPEGVSAGELDRPATTQAAPDTTDQSLPKATGRTAIIFA